MSRVTKYELIQKTNTNTKMNNLNTKTIVFFLFI